MALSSDQHPDNGNNPQDPSRRGSLTAEFLATNHRPSVMRKISTLEVPSDDEEEEDSEEEKEEEEEAGPSVELSMWKSIVVGLLVGYVALKVKERVQDYFQ